MRKAHEDVADFHRVIGQPVGDVAKPDVSIDIALRVKLIAEEFDELLEALCPRFGESQFVNEAVEAWLREARELGGVPHLAGIADALADLEYVTVGAAVTWGIPGAAVWDEVHAANMRKAGGPRDPVTGKAGKPPGWRGPDIEGVLTKMAAGWHHCSDCGRISQNQCNCERDE